MKMNLPLSPAEAGLFYFLEVFPIAFEKLDTK